jgi:hypothetical protein
MTMDKQQQDGENALQVKDKYPEHNLIFSVTVTGDS